MVKNAIILQNTENIKHGEWWRRQGNKLTAFALVCYAASTLYARNAEVLTTESDYIANKNERWIKKNFK